MISKKAEDKRLSMNSEMAEVVMVTDIDALHLAIKIACDEVSRYPVFFNKAPLYFYLIRYTLFNGSSPVIEPNCTLCSELNPANNKEWCCFYSGVTQRFHIHANTA